jgi:glutamate N-acetyltransferase/amino-acid N-acetyltransferase
MEEKSFVVKGFKASAVSAGLRKESGLDLALIFCDTEAVGAGVFTQNKVKAAPVLLSQENIRDGRVRAVIANSGNANASTGPEGLHAAQRTAARVAQELGIRPEEVLVASTGVIGAPLDTALIEGAIPELVRTLSPDGIPRAAEAIMTTDSFPKLARFHGEAGGKPFNIVGIAKGAGMIMPQMATMLCFVLSDIAIESSALRDAVRASVEPSFNRITVDGDTSTNDTVVVMANGRAANGAMRGSDYESFAGGLAQVMGELATMIVRDGEGATKVVQIVIRGASTAAEATAAARTIANSTLVKTAFYGQDPNWGRIMAALGRSGIQMKEELVDIWIDGVKIVEGGIGQGMSAERSASQKMANKEFSVLVALHQGEHEDRILTCDLTHEYVTINATYRT